MALAKKIERTRRATVDARGVSRMLTVLRREAPKWNAPIVSFIAVQHRDPFRTLISCILSLRTKDATTAAAQAAVRASGYAASDTRAGAEDARAAHLSGRILSHQGESHPRNMPRLDRQVRRTRARRDRRAADAQRRGSQDGEPGGDRGVRKPGICVDTHVHRISNRWGLVRTKTPDQTEVALRAVLPSRHWIEYNGILVAFGQTICHPTSPWCSRCKIAALCPRIGVVHSR